MRIGFYSSYSVYNKNRMFLDPSSPIGDNLMYPFFYLGKQLEKMGHSAATIDTDDLKNFDTVVFLEFPTFKNKYFKHLVKNKFEKLYLMVMESPIVRPNNLDLKNHVYFKKIFTWQDNLVDNKKYFRINYAHGLPAHYRVDTDKKEKLCALIASNKGGHAPGELYSERRRAIRWFEANHPEDFDLYGKNWDRFNFSDILLGVNLARLNRLTFLTKLLAPHYPSYRGQVISKKTTYQNYKFSLCYENVSGFPGYITEKIMDGFLGGTIPIYLGAPNITDHIPKETFIDKRDFKTYGELYHYIKHMPEIEYQNYLGAIKNFLEGPNAYPFSAECFANTIIKEIT
ncbi:MAG: hypothetical protein A3C50_03530 [Candidatus Staskawiczbacteria bacterium RIFCSPHIGHO2_02_FULL_43_16]|uniref:Fucosyltransferase C-terminal domain-containing protein n=1 Tax=Candidatus Staskawiczbacteria bacterium RIFCSPHIGHO2_01_FULL_41_41 TaxID=1802203 RepID=A0A1G2HSI1_9BACT|nr:MAG: hypothetical protein A2822_02635 [Candidatus Staskawiczbacteria bacterium RIFCSPHIGHO2_01_FULL_41_41]OGZ68009.1 MAG: hypothetical protein A3C50_03530 [Candidatus Staskawiczbacteria bacterium RIFCSPHIGHO2_02_FULL_43_16]OGZ74574.1 MAG: hypothetical protein A3A12_02330 [Candidatus Staskawiczbacteria bacterium RIFCSPLOWO2_01_FULL_43_17b]